MRRVRRWVPALVGGLWVAGLLVPGLQLALLYLAPALLLATLLLADRYPGAAFLERLAARRMPARRRRVVLVACVRPPRRTLARGGALLACGLASRPPPCWRRRDSSYSRRRLRPISSEQEHHMHHRTLAGAVLGITALAVAATAQAHVSLHPNVIPAKANVALTLRVPNESDTASTTSIDVKFPDGFLDVLVDAPGWTAKTITKKLATPVKTDEGTITEQVTEVRLTGGRLAPGRFGQFSFMTALPDSAKAGSVLTFKTVQTYSNGSVSRWIGGPSTEMPAPTIDVTGEGGYVLDLAGGEAGPDAGAKGIGASGATAAAPPAATAAPPPPVIRETKTGSKGLAIAALALAVVALGAAGAARRRA